MATAAQLKQDLINAVAKVRVSNQGAPMDVKFSDGKTYTVYNDGSGAGDALGINFRDLTGSFNSAESALRPAPAPTPIAQVAPQPAPQPAAQPAQSTPVAQVAPAATAGSQLPTLKQSIIDDQFKNRRTNELTSFNSDIRDQIYNAGWGQKSDAVRVLNGAGVYGIISAPEGMGGTGYKSVTGKVATDQDFVNAAKAAGIDPSAYYSKQTIGIGGSQNVLNKTKLYDALQAKGKDLYSVTNALSGAARGDSAPHATVLYKADGSGNLVPQNNPETGQPEVKYFDAVRYANAPSFMEEFGPFLGMAGLAFGAPYLQGLAGGTTAALEAGQIGAMGAGAGAGSTLGLGAGAGLGTGTMAGTMLGGTGATLGTTAGIASGLGTAGLLGGGTAAGLPLNQVGALTSTMTPQQVAALKTTGDVVGAGGALANGIGMGAGGAAAGNAIANALANNGLYNLLGSGAGALASYLGASGQADAAKQAAENQMSMFNTINKQLIPQRGAGYQALNQIRSMLPGQSMAYDELGNPVGVQTGNDYLTRQFTPQDLQAGLAPNYQFMLGQGQQQTQRQANLSGGAMGGNALRALQDYTQNYAGNAYQNAFQNFQNQRTGIYNTLAGIAGIGQNATNTAANAGQAATTAAGQLGVGSAAAQAAGLQGVANAASGGLQNYQQNQILQAILGQNQNVAQYQNTASTFPNVA